MKLSQRISVVGASETLAITAKANELKAQGIDVVGFGAGEPDFDTPQFIKDACKAALDAGDTKYGPRQGAKLCQAIADKLARENDVHVKADQVVVTFGGKHALYDLCQVLLDPGDKVIIPAPYWVSYVEMVKLAGGENVIIHAGVENNFKITPDQLRQAAKGAKALILNSPSNPTGVTYTPAELKALADVVLETDLIVISDEIYEKLVYGDTKFVSFAALDPRLGERTITVNGLAKTYSMTGWRLGWVAGPKDVIGAIKRLMSHETTNPVSFAQAGALAAYTSPEAPATVEKMRREFERRGRHMARRLNEIPGVTCVEPTGAFYCFPDVSAHYGKTLGGIEVKTSADFSNAAIASANVAVVPGGAFGDDKCIRLSFATSMEQIDKGIDRLAKLLS
ncbi:MAG: Aspartate aminotransferase [Planctomycetes bacterium ADurb.Bin126]|nr:MAG: Aspartate aminotransferase [Planctomycetes bacterium ADurb.Bin126]HOD84852.1 pyridoxal phosphate-dependent aminotransferase [Phycisphaerae bacterium]HQL75178.1 pyridoxal phosphate-dependent aminotransferase [Phycisphaerae bacterium]